MKTAALAVLLAFGVGCFTAAERREYAEVAVRAGVIRAADVVLSDMEKDGFTVDEVRRFAAWIVSRADRIADRVLDRIMED